MERQSQAVESKDFQALDILFPSGLSQAPTPNPSPCWSTLFLQLQPVAPSLDFLLSLFPCCLPRQLHTPVSDAQSLGATSRGDHCSFGVFTITSPISATSRFPVPRGCCSALHLPGTFCSAPFCFIPPVSSQPPNESISSVQGRHLNPNASFLAHNARERQPPRSPVSLLSCRDFNLFVIR